MRIPSRSKRLDRNARYALIAVALLIAIAIGIYAGGRGTAPGVSVSAPLSLIQKDIKTGLATHATIYPETDTIVVKLTSGRIVHSGYPIGYDRTLVGQLEAAKVPVTVPPKPGTSLLLELLPSLLLMFMLVGVLLFYLRSVMNVGNLRGGGRSGIVPVDRYSDVIGYPQAVASVQEATAAVADPESFEKLGARPPAGMLLTGPPGTGKTLLARAAAGSLGCPLYVLSGSSFVEKVTGVGPARIRQVFKSARKHQRAIIFIDELDAIGRRRGGVSTGGDMAERESTLNQLLVEMDGFDQGGQVLVLGATNRVELLDSALRRPGRFDRTVHLPPPDRVGRFDILTHYWEKLPSAEPVDLAAVARRTAGWVGAGLANLVNESAITAARLGAQVVGYKHLEMAMADLSMGPARAGLHGLTDNDIRTSAYHEAGHAIAALVQQAHPDPVCISIQPRGEAGGVTWMDGRPDSLVFASQLRSELVVLMAGRAAEQVCYSGDFTQGAQSDLAAASMLAGNMVCQWGMYPGTLVTRNLEHRLELQQVEVAQQRLLNDALECASLLLSIEYQEALHRVAAALIECEQIDIEQLRQLVYLPSYDNNGVLTNEL